MYDVTQTAVGHILWGRKPPVVTNENIQTTLKTH